MFLVLYLCRYPRFFPEIQPLINKTTLTDFFSSMTDHKDNDADLPNVGDLFNFLRQIWRAIIVLSPLQQHINEKQLAQYLDLKFLIPLELAEACEKQEPEASGLPLKPPKDGPKTCSSLLTPPVRYLHFLLLNIVISESLNIFIPDDYFA